MLPLGFPNTLKLALSIVLATAAAAMIIALPQASPTRAATAVYVDATGVCNGLSPCFTTIQEGINNAGPAPATLNVFPGTYRESVELTLMGSAIGGGDGDITLRTVNASGAPAPGTATINPNVGDGITTSLTSPFQGDVTIDGFNITSPDGDGIFVDVNGDVTIRNVISTNNDSDGVEVLSTGNITVESSQANGSKAGVDHDGFVLSADGDVLVTDSTANDNNNEGIDIEHAGGTVRIANCTTQGNGDEGVDVDEAASVTVDNCTTVGNGDDGLEFGDFDLGIAGDVTVRNSTVTGNTDDGIDLSLSGTGDLKCNAILGNGTGLRLKTNSSVDAELNWWGSVSGPSHPSNPGGTGEAVRDSANGESGALDFNPWLIEPTACQPEIWGDLDCSGAVDAVDALKGLRDLAALPISQSEPCPDIGTTVEVVSGSSHQWGDLDCLNGVDAVDVLKLLRQIASLAVEQAEPCPDIGTTVTVVVAE